MAVTHALSPLRWHTDGYWCAPDGWRLGLDCRALQDQTLRGEYGDWPWCYVLSGTEQPTGDMIALGSGRVDEVKPSQKERDGWRTAFTVDPIGDTLLDWMWNLATEQANADGSTLLKPLVSTREGDTELRLPLHSLVRSRKFGPWNPSGNRHHNIVRDLLRADLKRTDKEAKESAKELRKQGKENEAKHAEKLASRVLDATCCKYGCDPRDISTDIQRGRATTTISDAFGASLTGWTAQSGTWATRDAGSGDYRLYKSATDGTAGECVRHNTALSSADHYSQAVVSGNADFDNEFGPMARFASGAATGYSGMIGRYSSSLFKLVAGSKTDLGSGSGIRSSSYVQKQDSSGSTQKFYVGGSAYITITDSAISGNLYVGCQSKYTYAGSYTAQLNDFYATDGISGWTKKLHGIAAANMARVHGTAKANIAKILGT